MRNTCVLALHWGEYFSNSYKLLAQNGPPHCRIVYASVVAAKVTFQALSFLHMVSACADAFRVCESYVGQTASVTPGRSGLGQGAFPAPALGRWLQLSLHQVFWRD